MCMAPPTAGHLLSPGKWHTFKVHRKASGAVSGHRETQVCMEEDTAVMLDSFAVSLPSRIKIPFKKESFQDNILRKQPS